MSHIVAAGDMFLSNMHTHCSLYHKYTLEHKSPAKTNKSLTNILFSFSFLMYDTTSGGVLFKELWLF